MGLGEWMDLICGAALFLYGMALMGEGLKRLSGKRLGPILFRLTHTNARSILLGAGVTAVIQSSSATAVMAAGFVRAGLMGLKQAVGVILGAILGTSATGWLVCLRFLGGGAFAGILSSGPLTAAAVLGIALRLFSRRPARQCTGEILMGFVVLMTGMEGMSGAAAGLGELPWFQALLASVSHPLAGILAGAALGAALQSASAAVGVLQALSAAGTVTAQAAVPLLLGIAIGASVPVLLSAAGTGEPKTALAYLLCTSLGTLVCACLFSILPLFPPELSMDPFTVALANTLLRLIMVLVLCPFTDAIEEAVLLLTGSVSQGRDAPCRSRRGRA